MVVSSSRLARWCWCSNTAKKKEKERRRRPFFSSRGKHQRRRDDDGHGNIVSLRRGEFKGREDPPPWDTRWSFESHLLNLRGTTTERDDDDDKTEKDDARIDIKAKVETSGPHSYFVNADVTGHVRCRCVSCGETFRHPIESGFTVFLDERATTFGDVSGDVEIVPFPRSTEHIDLTSVARSWIEMNLKEEFVCEDCESEDDAAETWRLEYDDGEVTTETKRFLQQQQQH